MRTGASAIESICQGLRQPGGGHLRGPPAGLCPVPRCRSRHPVIETEIPGPAGERYCWYQCTVKGGREGRDVDAVTLARVCENLGAGEILLNCIDRDGTRAGSTSS